MDIDFFKMVIEQIKEFPNKLKLLNFAWLGEPLLHPNIAEMVKIAKSADIADRVEIVSNASMLTPSLSDALIEAGLDRIRISLQGLSEYDYYEISKYRINFDELVRNIKYFYEKSQNMGGHSKVYIKIMDSMLKNEHDEEIFQNLFSGICDTINIETLVPLVGENDISNLKQNFEKDYWNNTVKETIVCSQPFYLMVVTPEGEVLPCCEIGTQMNLGKISKDNTIVNIWNGERMDNIRKMMINNERCKHPICGKCNVVKYQTSNEDNLDNYIDELKVKYK
jgi:radical SAM protein with 4Fe4S-binding SPASM domain